MLCRVSCKACRLSSIWTDDPSSFLQTVCQRYRHCEAQIKDETFRVRMRPRRIEQEHAASGKKHRHASAHHAHVH